MDLFCLLGPIENLSICTSFLLFWQAWLVSFSLDNWFTQFSHDEYEWAGFESACGPKSCRCIAMAVGGNELPAFSGYTWKNTNVLRLIRIIQDGKGKNWWTILGAKKVSGATYLCYEPLHSSYAEAFTRKVKNAFAKRIENAFVSRGPKTLGMGVLVPKPMGLCFEYHGIKRKKPKERSTWRNCTRMRSPASAIERTHRCDFFI